MAWDSDTAKLYPASLRIKKETASKGISVQSIGKKAEILGKWFAQCDLSTLTAYLGVVL
ncbi:hypothetical protein AGMMS50267_18060 [Spirochaetia bacterium]|nr:hypothetical protein AGMMS50267_18060 [Spirochaetia bacterium]